MLISKPEPGDPRFESSVSLVCDHDDQGSFALILNKPTEIYLDIRDFSVSEQQTHIDQFPLWYGGPVQVEQCFYLFQHIEKIEGSENVLDDLYLASSKDVLSKLLKSTQRENLNIKFFLGYAGWSFFQLDCEISYGWWLTGQGDHDCPFNTSPKKLGLST